MNPERIRNFSIIAHVDHGKSTLADRLLERTGTIPDRLMRDQFLDRMDLERERGITIKMQPVRMKYNDYVLNLIDTPGHSDFSYEVSRALTAVEGAILLVDATQGIQAQTLANLRAAEHAGLTIIGAVNKIDMNPDGIEDLMIQLAELLHCDPEEIHKVSGKTGAGVEELLEDIVKKIPSPRHSAFSPRESATSAPDHALVKEKLPSRALVFDSFYDNHKGIVASVRVFNGTFRAGEDGYFAASREKFKMKEVGAFTPELKTKEQLEEGEIGYIATGIKDPEKVKIGDTIISANMHRFATQINADNVRENQRFSPRESASLALPGYKEPMPVVFVSFYPDDPDEYELLKNSLQKLRLNDSSISIEPDMNEVLGRGYKVGFLGRLHFEIVAERLKREFNVSIITTFPSVAYKIKQKKGWIHIVSASDLPSEYEEIWEPMAKIELIMPREYVNNFFGFQSNFRFGNMETETMQQRKIIKAEMPLSELISDFDDQLKSATEGYASFSYELGEYKKSDVVKVDFLVASEIVPGLSRFFHRSVFEREARQMVERLKVLLPQQQFTQAVQAQALGKIMARETIPAMRKDVTGYLYGGDRTRKMKLWKKQKRGKERLKERAHVHISPEIFRELLKK